LRFNQFEERSMSDKFLLKLADILEVSEVQMADEFRNFDSWDSLSALAIIANVEKYFGINITVSELVQLKTVGSLLERLQ